MYERLKKYLRLVGQACVFANAVCILLTFYHIGLLRQIYSVNEPIIWIGVPEFALSIYGLGYACLLSVEFFKPYYPTSRLHQVIVALRKQSKQ